MPPHLHPRSYATTTLFVSTLAASFIIVGIPHIFPCPAPRRSYLDADGNVVRQQRRQRRRRDEGGGEKAGTRCEDVAASIRPEEVRFGMPSTSLPGPRLSEGIETISKHPQRPSLPPESIPLPNRLAPFPSSTDVPPTPNYQSRHTSPTPAPARTTDEQELQSLFRALEAEATALAEARRECPVPKPRGWLGDKLGFGRDGDGGWGRGRDRETKTTKENEGEQGDAGHN